MTLTKKRKSTNLTNKRRIDTMIYINLLSDFYWWPQPTNQPTNCNLKLTKLHTTNDLFLTSTNIKATADVSNSVKRLLLMLLATTDYCPLPWSPKLYRLQILHKPQTNARISIESNLFYVGVCATIYCSNKCFFWNKIQLYTACD